MSTYTIHYNDEIGDIVEIDYCDSVGCMRSRIWQETGLNAVDIAGDLPHPEGGSISYGAAPCAASDLDYAVYCAICGEPMNDLARAGVSFRDELP